MVYLDLRVEQTWPLEKVEVTCAKKHAFERSPTTRVGDYSRSCDPHLVRWRRSAQMVLLSLTPYLIVDFR